jgi:hypothetical protein
VANVTATGLSLSGADAGNYGLASTSAATTGDITVRTLTVSATGANKVYDGTTAATVTLSDDRVSGDVLSTSFATASFAYKNSGSGKTVSVSGIWVDGAAAANYGQHDGQLYGGHHRPHLTVTAGCEQSL